MIVRKVKENEIKDTMDLAWKVFLEYEAPDYSEEGILEFRRSINDPEFISKLDVYGAYSEDNNELLGMIATRGGNHIALFFVDAKYHRMGIGKMLYSTVCDLNKDDYFTANSSPYAKGVYEHLGFTCTNDEQVVNGIRFYPMKGYIKDRNGGMYMEIRIPNIDEYEIVNELAVQVHELHVGWRPDLFNSVDEVITLDEYMELIQNKEIYVSVIDNKVVGYIVFCIVEKISQNNKFRYRKQLNVDAMCVDETYRGRGIGTELLNFVEKIAIENECTDMYLTVNEENIGAIKTYENFGMRVKNIAYSKRLTK